MANIQLSVVIITFNEEKNIGRCLESVKEIADEIVVVDSFSTDDTQVICERFEGVKFVSHEFEGHIQQKNYALSRATLDHVLSIDADEVLTDRLKQDILSLKNNWQADGYFVNRANHYLGKRIRFCGWYPDKKLRIFDKRKATWGGSNPHDRIIMEEGSTIRSLHSDLNHYSYHSVDQHLSGINKFSTIAAREAFEQGKKATVIKIMMYPFFVFFKTYILRLGILDGYYGLIISYHHAYYRFLKYLKLRELWKHKEPEKDLPAD
ncbi:MAG: glycosyltransferase family 2 protein [Cyclobacteriaceae bacterium]|nr:glycosyltransferase family 2 protein [Cyclobacteriaceae bacterium]